MEQENVMEPVCLKCGNDKEFKGNITRTRAAFVGFNIYLTLKCNKCMTVVLEEKRWVNEDGTSKGE